MKFQHRQKPLQKIEGEIFVTTKKKTDFSAKYFVWYDLLLNSGHL